MSISSLGMIPQGALNTPDPFLDNVVLLMDFENEMAPLEDAAGRHTPIDGNAAIIRDAPSGSRALDGVEGVSLIRIPNSADFLFGTGDFTVEWFNNRENSSNDAAFIGIWDTSGERSWLVFRSFADVEVALSTDGNSNDLAMDTMDFESQIRQHMALVRDGNTFRMYMGGTERVSRVSAEALHNSTGDLYIGGHPGFSPSRGFMDDIRITKGICRYPDGTTFTPPDTPFPRPVPLVQAQRLGVSKASAHVIHRLVTT